MKGSIRCKIGKSRFMPMFNNYHWQEFILSDEQERIEMEHYVNRKIRVELTKTEKIRSQWEQFSNVN